VAASGSEALAVLGVGGVTFDIAVIDLMLPDTWGPQMAVAHSQLQPGLKVIYISGHGEDDAVLTATSTHSRDVAFLSKPFTTLALEQLIQKKLAPPPAAG
jgi:DNA-binding NtrC family response regulator